MRDCWVRYAAHASSQYNTKSDGQFKLLVGIHGQSKSYGDPVLILTSHGQLDIRYLTTYKAHNE